MPYPILRFEKKKMGGVAAADKHNERKKESYKSNPDIDRERSIQNYHLIKPEQTYRKEINRRIAAAGCKVRSNSTVMVETLITASPEFMEKLSPPQQREYFNLAFEFMSGKVGKDRIIAATVHMDEKTPHMHLSFCPITSDNRLSAKSILGNQAQLSKWQTEYHECMSSRWNELERGVSSMITKRKHIPVWLFKQADRLDKQFNDINAALADINVFNAGKKKDKAIALLAEWLPEAEKFTAQIKTVDSHIESLKKGNADYERELRNRNSSLQDKVGEKEKELRMSKSEIYHLKETIRKQQRLLEHIPPDVLEQLKTNKNRRKER